jgi:hypothetical protein
MRGLRKLLGPFGILMLAFAGTLASSSRAAADDRASVVIVFKDGHRQSFAATEISRIDFKAPSVVFKDGHQEKIATADIARIEFDPVEGTAMMPSRAHFIGKWEVRMGPDSGTFFITLEANGDAKKTHGEEHGTWTLVDGEARIAWDDGWHDIIRKVGAKHEKVAFAPGRSFDDAPSNVTTARNTNPKPI